MNYYLGKIYLFVGKNVPWNTEYKLILASTEREAYDKLQVYANEKVANLSEKKTLKDIRLQGAVIETTL